MESFSFEKVKIVLLLNFLRFPWIALFVAAFWPACRNSPMIFHKVSRIFMVKFHRVREISLVIFQSPPDWRHMTWKNFRLFLYFFLCALFFLSIWKIIHQKTLPLWYFKWQHAPLWNFKWEFRKKVAYLEFPFEKPQAKVHNHVIFHMGRRVGAFPCERSHGYGAFPHRNPPGSA